MLNKASIIQYIRGFSAAFTILLLNLPIAVYFTGFFLVQGKKIERRNSGKLEKSNTGICKVLGIFCYIVMNTHIMLIVS